MKPYDKTYLERVFRNAMFNKDICWDGIADTHIEGRILRSPQSICYRELRRFELRILEMLSLAGFIAEGNVTFDYDLHQKDINFFVSIKNPQI